MLPPRPPALSHALTSALWGAGLGVFIWVGLLSVELTSRLAALIIGIFAGIGIFFFVLVHGDQARHRQQDRKRRTER